MVQDMEIFSHNVTSVVSRRRILCAQVQGLTQNECVEERYTMSKAIM